MKLKTSLYLEHINESIPVVLEFEVTEEGVTEHHIFLDVATSGMDVIKDTALLNTWFNGPNDDKFDQFDEECLKVFNNEQHDLELDSRLDNE